MNLFSSTVQTIHKIHLHSMATQFESEHNGPFSCGVAGRRNTNVLLPVSAGKTVRASLSDSVHRKSASRQPIYGDGKALSFYRGMRGAFEVGLFLALSIGYDLFRPARGDEEEGV